ncbi:MAG: sulfotransferase [Phycisphaerales bacterium]|nr:sulfotransferase [Phycisphaerales bacterium]
MAAALRQLLKSTVGVFAPASTRADAAVSIDARPWRCCDVPDGDAFSIRDGERRHRFFFITGCYKSGTHWVENILNQHPDVIVKGEFHLEALRRGVDELVDTRWYLTARPRLRGVIDDSYHAFVRRVMFAETRDKPTATWIGDRTPRLLQELLPGAPIVNIRRDGRDVMVSWNFQHLRTKNIDLLMPEMRASAERFNPRFQQDPAAFAEPGSGYLGDERWFRTHAKTWADMVHRELDEAPRLRECGTPVLQLVYERMHEDIAAARASLYAFLGLDPAAAAPLSRETRTLPGFDEPAPSKFYRKGEVGEWRSMFTPQQCAWFQEVAGDALLRAEYEQNASWASPQIGAAS